MPQVVRQALDVFARLLLPYSEARHPPGVPCETSYETAD
jgi:hypothetical protein